MSKSEDSRTGILLPEPAHELIMVSYILEAYSLLAPLDGASEDYRDRSRDYIIYCIEKRTMRLLEWTFRIGKKGKV